MKAFIKNNPTLAFGLGLPLLLVVIFAIATGIPNINAVPPKYDPVFVTNYTNYYNGNGLRINVINGRASAVFEGECNYCQPPEIYRYNSEKGTLKRIDVTLPPEARMVSNGQPNDAIKHRVIPVKIPELEDLKLDSSNPAPDGYEFTFNAGHTNEGVLTSLFFERSSYYNTPLLKKGNYRIRIPISGGYYDTNNVHFLGWVVSQ